MHNGSCTWDLAKWELKVILTVSALRVAVWRPEHVQHSARRLGSEAVHVTAVSWIQNGGSARGRELRIHLNPSQPRSIDICCKMDNVINLVQGRSEEPLASTRTYFLGLISSSSCNPHSYPSHSPSQETGYASCQTKACWRLSFRDGYEVEWH